MAVQFAFAWNDAANGKPSRPRAALEMPSATAYR